MFRKILHLIVDLLNGNIFKPAKEKAKAKLDADSARTESIYVKKRNDVEKALLDAVDEDLINAGIDKAADLAEKKLKK